MKKSRLFPILFMLFALTACDKNESVDPTVTAEELLDYQMFWGLTDPNGTFNLRMLYFEKSGTDIKATLDGISTRNTLNATVINNVLKLDLNGNGSVVYTIEFERKKDEINVKSAKFYNLNNPGYQMSDGAVIYPISAFPSVKNSVFESANNLTIIRFNVGTWLYGKHPNTTGSYYECGYGGFKGKIQGVDHFGLSFDLPEIGRGLLLQTAGIKNPETFIIYP